MEFSSVLFAQVMEFVPWKTFGRIIGFWRPESSVNRTSH
jgi:hypothetical protein